MSGLEALLNDLANLDAGHDLDGLRQVRERIVAEFPDSEPAAEAQYKLGLDLLFRGRDTRAAIECFKAAAGRKHPFWSPAARISMALCIYHRGDVQKAMFELRKVAYPEEPSANSVTALTFISTILEEIGSKPDELARARKDRVKQLERLAKAASNRPAERAHYLHQLGLEALRDGDARTAEARFREAAAPGPEAIGADLHATLLLLIG